MQQDSLNKTAYVIMPVSSTTACTDSEWADIYNEVFAPALTESGYLCEKAYPSTGNLIKSLVIDLQKSWLVLADLTDRNANVFYELGVRHALSKRTILVAQNSGDIPSDLKGYWWLEYGTKPGEVSAFRKRLKELLIQIEEDPERSDNPVSDFLDHEMAGVSNYVFRENAKKLSALFTELTGTVNTLRQIETDSRFVEFLHSDCLDLLLCTLYIDVGSDLLRKCHELRHSIRVIESGINRSSSFVVTSQTLASEILNDIHTLRKMYSRGEYTEPENVSVMIWTPVSQSATDSGGYSRSEDLSKIDIGDLRDHFGGLRT